VKPALVEVERLRPRLRPRFRLVSPGVLTKTHHCGTARPVTHFPQKATLDNPRERATRRRSIILRDTARSGMLEPR
jgi:hypothetical protein